MENNNINWRDIDTSIFQNGTSTEIPLTKIFEESFAKYLCDIAQASGSPVDYTVLNVMVISSAIIGNKARISVWNGWDDEPAHLWGALIGAPSTKKTASRRPILKALKPLIEARKLEYQNKKKEYQVALENFEAKEISDKPQKPILRQLLISDTTVEAIHRAIDPENPECICVFRDELSGLMGSISKYSDGDRSFYLEGYSGNFYTVNRVKYDEPIIIPNLSISILGTIQPQKIRNMLREADDGFLSRFLFAFPKPIITEEPKTSVNEEKLSKIFQKLDQLPAKEKKISLSAEAKETFKEWHAEHEKKTQSYTTRLLQSSYGKMGGQAVRMACVLKHIYWALSSETAPPTEISNDSILKAIVLVEEYFKQMAKKVFAECSMSADVDLTRAFVNYLADEKVDQFNMRDLKRKNLFPTLNDENTEQRLISTLVGANVIRRVESDSKGRPAKNYMVNPQLQKIKI
jgi:hypothetical protein